MKSERLDSDHSVTIRSSGHETPFIYLILVGFIPFLVLAAYIAWPEVAMLMHVSNIAVLLSGSLLISAALEKISGDRRPGRSFAWTLFTVIPGTLLFPLYGWVSTLLILGGFTLTCIVTGILRRFADRD